MSNKVVRVYSEAFFELSKDKNNLNLHKEQLSYVKEVLSNHDEIIQIIDNPNITKSDKKDFISQLFGSLDIDLLHMIYVLIDKSRFNILDDLIRDYSKKFNAEMQIMEGIVYSVNKLDETDMSDIKTALEKKYGKKIELENVIDETLIGGISIDIEGERIDNSIKQRLSSLKAQLMKEGE